MGAPCGGGELSSGLGGEAWCGALKWGGEGGFSSMDRCVVKWSGEDHISVVASGLLRSCWGCISTTDILIYPCYESILMIYLYDSQPYDLPFGTDYKLCKEKMGEQGS